MKGDNDILEGVIILVILIVIFIVSPRGAPTPANNSINSYNTPAAGGSGGQNIVAPSPSYTDSISIETGNASYAYQPYEEYITIYHYGREAVNITNWQLKNGKDKRAYDSGGTFQHFAADTAFIGQAAAFVSPIGRNIFQNVVLQDGESAVITTGVVGSRLPYKIVSFKENMCSGYLEDLPEYAFNPPLTRNCNMPADEPGVNNLGTECRKYIETMQYCRTPEFDTRDSQGNICRNCVDGKPLTSACVAFIKDHFNYGSCIVNHQNDANFSGRTWRIFLGRKWEMWAKDYETIELFDQLGRLVEYRSY